MKFSEIYNLVIPYWGSEIDISDYTITKVLFTISKSEKSEGYSKSSVNLSKKWDEVEKIIGTDEPYTDLMVWTMYQVFHKVSEDLFKQGKLKLIPNDVDQKQIEEQYYENLQADDWKNELARYTNDLI